MAAAMAGAVLVGAGGSYAFHHFRDTAAAGTCAVEGSKSIALEKKNPDEPTISIPLTDGWKHYSREDIGSNAMILDNPVIRGFVANPGIQTDNFTPNVVVTLSTYDGPSATPEEINNIDTRQTRQIGRLVGQSTSTACGATVFRKDFVGFSGAEDGKVQTGSAFLTVFESEDGKTWVSTATIQTRDPDNEKFIAERDALSQGFHLSEGS